MQNIVIPPAIEAKARYGIALSNHTRRDRIFGLPRGQHINRDDKAKIMVFARALSQRLRRAGQHGGPLTHAGEKVLRALLYSFHNNATGCCFPGYERLAEAAGVARSTVAEAVKAICALGIATVINRIAHRHITHRGRVVGRRVVRTSNAYIFRLWWRETAAESCKSENRSGPKLEEDSPSHTCATASPKGSDALERALATLQAAMIARQRA